MRNNILKIIRYGIPVAAAAAVGVLYGKLPKKIPVHWDLQGNVEYGEKIQIWFMVGLLVFFTILFQVLPKLDPRRKNYSKFQKFYDSICLGIQLFLVAMMSIIISEAFYPGRVSVDKAVSFLVGVLLIFIGNYMPKVKSNFYMGVRSPWALSDEENWRKTHRLAGKLFVGAGIIMIAAVWLLPASAAFPVSMAAVMAAGLIPYVMSYIWWKKKTGVKKAAL